MGIMLKGIAKGGNIRMGNHGTSANNPCRTESSWRLKELTEGVVTLSVGNLFQYFTTRVEKDDFLRRRRLGLYQTVSSLATLIE